MWQYIKEEIDEYELEIENLSNRTAEEENIEESNEKEMNPSSDMTSQRMASVYNIDNLENNIGPGQESQINKDLPGNIIGTYYGTVDSADNINIKKEDCYELEIPNLDCGTVKRKYDEESNENIMNLANNRISVGNLKGIYDDESITCTDEDFKQEINENSHEAEMSCFTSETINEEYNDKSIGYKFITQDNSIDQDGKPSQMNEDTQEKIVLEIWEGEEHDNDKLSTQGKDKDEHELEISFLNVTVKEETEEIFDQTEYKCDDINIKEEVDRFGYELEIKDLNSRTVEEGHIEESSENENEMIQASDLSSEEKEYQSTSKIISDENFTRIYNKTASTYNDDDLEIDIDTESEENQINVGTRKNIILKIWDGESVIYYTLCPICGQIPMDLEKHMLIHHEMEPFECQKCGERFRKEFRLKQHFRSHIYGIPPHKCKICGKCFAYRSRLREHMCLHSSDRPLKCNICEKGFRRRAYLQKHLKTHLNGKPPNGSTVTAQNGLL